MFTFAKYHITQTMSINFFYDRLYRINLMGQLPVLENRGTHCKMGTFAGHRLSDYSFPTDIAVQFYRIQKLRIFMTVH